MLHKRAVLASVPTLLLFLLLMIGVAFAQNTPKTTHLPLITRATSSTPSIPTPLPLRTGEATYYDGANGTGNCSFPASPQDLMIGAMNHVDYAGSAICGAFVELTGPKGTITIRIVDQCPGCAAGDIDLSPEAFARIAELSQGRVPISWQIVSPAISSPIRYFFKEGSSQWWTAIQIRNHRNPIAKLEYQNASGQFIALPRADYNFFIAEHGLGPGPYTLRVTDWYGNTLLDHSLPLRVGAEVAGSAQFP